MAIISVTQDDIETTTTLVNPVRSYSSSSSGTEGSIQLFLRSSDIEKEVRPLDNFQSSVFKDNDIEAAREDLAVQATNIAAGNGSFIGSLSNLVDLIHNQPQSAKKQKKIDVLRFTPSYSFTSNTVRKLNIKDSLMNFYKGIYPTADWSYSNYNSLNFFTSTSVPDSSVLLYPNIQNNSTPDHLGYVSGTYCLSGAFSFDFYINPRYKTENFSDQFDAGTIFHFSSSYALSLVTGSLKDYNGRSLGYRLQLQLSHSADIPPSQATPGSFPNDLVFLSDDNSLEWNKWHRVVVRWGTQSVNHGTGSFNIDGIDKGVFVIPSGTISPQIFTTQDEPSVLCLGNYYEGTNSLFDSQLNFFADVPAEREGLVQLIDNGATQDEPASYQFRHPLNAELHEISIKRHYMTNLEISQTQGLGLSELDSSDVAFYVPPLFVESTPLRKFVNFSAGSSYGGILQTPFFEIDGTTDDPFNVAMSFGVGGHYINLENFVKDFANNTFPRLHMLSGSAIEYTSEARPANEFLYDDERVRKRNLTILPCDNGNFSPNYSVLSGEPGNKYKNSFGFYDPSVIRLDDLLNLSSLLMGSTHDADHDSSFLDDLIGFSPENPGKEPGPAVISNKNAVEESGYGPGVQKNAPLIIFQRTKDASSNQVTIFDISNLFYGSKILPGSFSITDSNFTGSAGKISITLKDDGRGNIYRADSLAPHCTWNSVGNIFYNEGIVLIKSPHLYFFGKESYEMSFRGEYQLNTSKYDIVAPRGFLNSSSNPSYAIVEETIKPSLDPIDTEDFVYVSEIYLHDDNLNVVAKAHLAQPIIKREGDKILFRISFDW